MRDFRSRRTTLARARKKRTMSRSVPPSRLAHFLRPGGRRAAARGEHRPGLWRRRRTADNTLGVKVVVAVDVVVVVDVVGV